MLTAEATNPEVSQGGFYFTRKGEQERRRKFPTIVSETSSRNVFSSGVFCNTFIESCILLLEIRDFNHAIGFPQLYFAWKWQPISSSPVNLRHGAKE